MPFPSRAMLASAAGSLLVLLFIFAPSRPRFPGPATILWAWERPEDLRSIDTSNTGVAFLATTLKVRGSEVQVVDRAQPLLVSAGTYLIAVTRIETQADQPAQATVIPGIATAIAETAKLPGVRAIQVDFDARDSERAFYRQVLEQVRLRLTRAMPLSITALASWCIGDRWLQGMEFDEAVPMLFQMGPDARAVREHLRSGGALASSCVGAAGFGTDEAAPALARTARTYWFSPKPWTREQIARLEDLQ
jgi:hypothetical protein